MLQEVILTRNSLIQNLTLLSLTTLALSRKDYFKSVLMKDTIYAYVEYIDSNYVEWLAVYHLEALLDYFFTNNYSDSVVAHFCRVQPEELMEVIGKALQMAT